VTWKATNISSLRLSALSAALNLCQDFVPAQEEAVKLGILDELGSLLSTSGRSEIQVALRLLQAVRPILKDTDKSLSADLISRCIIVATSAPRFDDDQDDFITCLEILMEFLRDPGIQKTIGTGEHKNALLDLLENLVIRITSVAGTTEEDKQDAAYLGHSEDDESSDNDIDELADYAAELAGIAGEVACYWTFSPPSLLQTDEDVQDLVQVLQSEWKQPWVRDKRLFTSRAAALMLGNIARTDEICEALGTGETLLTATLDIVRAEGLDLELRHAVAGFLTNLGIEQHNKERLRATGGGVLSSVSALLESTNDDLRLDGLKLLRQVLRDSSENCEEFVSGVRSPCCRAFEEVIKTSDDENPRLQTEAGRVLVAISRTIALSGGDTAKLEDRIVKTELGSISAISLILRLSQNPDPRMKSECWIGLALASKTSLGATSVLKALQRFKDDYIETLKLALVQEVPAEYPSAAKDKENILVLVNYLVENAEFSDQAERSRLKELWSKHRNIVGSGS
jgi:hypothetical protein